MPLRRLSLSSILIVGLVAGAFIAPSWAAGGEGGSDDGTLATEPTVPAADERGARQRPLVVVPNNGSKRESKPRARSGGKKKAKRKARRRARSTAPRVVEGRLGTAASSTSNPVSDRSASLIVAGDIANCDFIENAHATARAVERMGGVVITTGDNAYDGGTLSEFQECYEPTWGRFFDRTRPAPGNHEHRTAGASGYFDYFGSRAGRDGRGYYSFKVGAWRIYSLDSTQCDRAGCGPASAQYRWLKRKLESNSTRCVLAAWHHPRFSSGKNGDKPEVAPLMQLLYDAGAELVVAGHDHNYERLARVRPNGTRDADHGLRSFVVGTGGTELREMGSDRDPNSIVFDSTTHGVLRLTLHPKSYQWEFVPVAGGTFTDVGRGRCHGAPR